MSDTGHPIWVLLFLIGLVPFAALGELAAAVFSKRVRRYIVSHPIAHFTLFAFAVLCILLLIPAHSTRHGVIELEHECFLAQQVHCTQRRMASSVPLSRFTSQVGVVRLFLLDGIEHHTTTQGSKHTMTTSQRSKLVKTNTMLWLAAIGLPAVLHFVLASSKFPWPVILPLLLIGPMLASNSILTKAIGDTTDDAA